MSYDPLDTIAAISSAAGGAARGIVRVSGPATAQIPSQCFKKGDGSLFSPVAHDELAADTTRSSYVCEGRVAVALDAGPPRDLPCSLLYWPTNRSYTREPVAEFHTFGSPPLLQAVLDAVCRAGARLAEPGEFTLRAFLAGRIDLTQAEAVLGVIDAQHPDQLHTAVAQLAGNLAQPLQQLRDDLLDLLAELEAGLDFVEEDIEFIAPQVLTLRLHAAADKLRIIAEQMSSRLAPPASYQVVLTGPPNAGKSSLFNALAARFGASDRRIAAAIVSDERGTTRDYLLSEIDLGGMRCELVDTAGLDENPLGEIAVAAQALAQDRCRQAVVRAYCVEAANVGNCTVPNVELVVVTKADLAPKSYDPSVGLLNDPPTVITSCVTGDGLDVLRQVLARLLAGNIPATSASCVAATADRCRDNLRLADAAVARAAEVTTQDGGDELVAAELRVALAELGKVVGATYTDDILDRIFSTFCIGK